MGAANKKCPACGRPMRKEPAMFELRAFIMRSGPRKGQLNISVWPDGLMVEHCYTDRGCGETLINHKVAATIDDARMKALNSYGASLISLLTDLRELVRL